MMRIKISDCWKYKICDKDTPIQIRFLKNIGVYKMGDIINKCVYMNSFGKVYIIDKKTHKMEFIEGKLLDDYMVKEIE